MTERARTSHDLDVTFYVPCLDEEANVGPALDDLCAVIERLGLRAEILVFDDGSRDATGRVATEFGGRWTKRLGDRLRFEVVRNPTPRGLGTNFFAGAARAHGVRYMLVNGDHSERIETLEAVLSRLGEADIVTTFFADGDVRGPLRRGLSRLFTALVNRLNGHDLRYYNGPTLHPRIDVVRLATPCRGFAYQAELLTRQLDAGRTVLEVPMVNRDRESGVTKAFRPRNLASVAASLGRIGLRLFPRIEDGPPAEDGRAAKG
ncbi:MAG: glycosyltransferase [Acidobacteriota bacterium]